MEIENDDTDSRFLSLRRWVAWALVILVIVGIAAGVLGQLAYRDSEQRKAALKIPALERYLAVCTRNHHEIEKLYNLDVIGGEAHKLFASEREMWLARADLSLVRGDRATAVAQLQSALKAADDCLLGILANFAYGPIDRHVEHRARQRICEIELKLAELSPEAIDEVPRKR